MRNIYSQTNILNELKFYHADWHNYLRMNEETYFKLLSLHSFFVEKKDIIVREAISPNNINELLQYLSHTFFMFTGHFYLSSGTKQIRKK